MSASKILCIVLALAQGAAFAKDEPLMSVGVARIDITPEYPVRLHGYGGRHTNSQGVAQRIFAKALAFGTDRQGASILFTVDNLAVSGAVTDEVAARLKKRAGIDREQVALCSSHTHSAPMLTGVAPNIFSSDIIPEQQAGIDRYTRELVDDLERVALAALSNRGPARLSWSAGTVKFAKNRRVVRDGRAQFGENDNAPVDHTLATMFVHGADGTLRGVLVNYACHCTTLGGEWNQVHGDWSGCAQEAIERNYPGTIALVSIGCGADANPSPRGNVQNAQAHGNEIAKEVQRLLASSSQPLTKLPDGKLKRFTLDFDPLPTRAQWEERAKRSGIVGYHAKKNLARLDRGERLPTKLSYSVQTWTFDDDLAMVFLPGEVVIDYQRRLKRELDSTRLWVNAYANDGPCYIPSRRILSEGGYEAEDSLWYYDRPARLATNTEERIIKAVHDLLPRKFKAREVRGDNADPRSPKQALNSFRMAPEFTVDLVAAEPLVLDPVAIDWGADGKLWVAEMRDYPMGIDGNWKPGGVVRFLEDRNNDGHYDKATEFLRDLPFPTGVFAWDKGVLICAAPDIIYAEDTTGDGRADVVKTVFTGFATENYQARVNSLSLGLDNWIYGANGLLGGKIRRAFDTFPLSSQSGAALSSTRRERGMAIGLPRRAEDTVALPPAGASEVDVRGRDFRFQPQTGAFEPASGLTQQGRVRDDFGNWFGCDNSQLLRHYPLADEYVRRNPRVAAPDPAVHVPQGPDWNRLFPASQAAERFNDPGHMNRVTSACGLEIYRDELLGKEFYGNAFTCETVHNVVHREVLVPHGVTFRSARATNELGREFLASTDNWFRPAQVRTGPDGALWVVDMYREIIEHPRWIPSNRLAQLDVRAGADKGRIYRVYRRNRPPRPIRNFAKLSTAKLAAALDSPNGTERDIVHRELLNRSDSSCAGTLMELAANSSRAGVRAQAWSVLQGISRVPLPTLETAFRRESDPLVQAHILRIGGEWPSGEFIAGAALHRDARVRFQAVLSASTNTPQPWLHSVCGEATTNVWMRAAVLSAVNGATPARLLLPSVWPFVEPAGNLALPDGLFATILAQESIEGALGTVLPLAYEEKPWGLRNARVVAERWRKQLSAGWPDAPDQLERKKQEFENLRRDMSGVCRRILQNTGAAQPVRTEAIKMLAAIFDEGKDREVLLAALQDGHLRSTTIDALIAAESPDVPGFFIPLWRQFSPTQRERIVNGLVSRAGWVDALLAALENRAVQATEISVPVRNQLLASTEANVRSRVEKLFPKRESNRAKIIADYRKALAAPGSAERGVEVFNNNCGACHVFNGRGTAVGPDITPLRDKSAEDFLVAILDPNAALEPRYVNYLVTMKSGAVFFGVIRSETATSIEIVSPGVHETLLRADVEKIEAMPTSLMPEGLEQTISPTEMNDLLALIKRPVSR